MPEMNGKIPMAFEPESVTIAISDIFPLKTVPASVRGSRKYRQIAASMKKARIAQPPIVSRHPSMKGRYLLLDGHLRIEVLKEQGEETVTCLVSLDDEAFTYNRQVNHLATIQEHKMILKLVERGIPEQTIAETLDVDIANIRMKRDLLNGISPDAAEMLKDRQCPINTIQTLKKMKPDRQVEAVELMIAMNDFTVPYAKTLVAATAPEQLVDPDRTRTRARNGISPEQLAQMEREMANLQRGIKRIEATYGSDHLNLVLAVGYVRSLLANDAISRFLKKYYPELRDELARICEVTALVSEAAE